MLIKIGFSFFRKIADMATRAGAGDRLAGRPILYVKEHRWTNREMYEKSPGDFPIPLLHRFGLGLKISGADDDEFFRVDMFLQSSLYLSRG